MSVFICREIHQRDKYGLSILLPAADVVWIFGEKFKLSRITEVPQAHCQLRLSLNMSEKLDKGTPIVNNTTDREVTPESMQFGISFTCILQAIWEAHPIE